MANNDQAANALNPNYTKTYRMRIRFEKTGVMRYVGHLDTMRYFQKAIRRADIPIAYSKGFHPHQIMSFALPLGIGVTTEGDYMDIELVEDISCTMVVDRLNEQMAEGVRIISATKPAEKSKKAMSAVEAASYRVTVSELSDEMKRLIMEKVSLKGERFDINESVRGFFGDGIRRFFDDQDEIVIEKKTKKGSRTLDLKPLIHSFVIADEGLVFEIVLSAGSVNNIKPGLLFNRFFEFLGIVDEADLDAADDVVCGCRLMQHRLDLLTENSAGELVSLSEV